MPMAPAQHRSLLRSALICILPAAVATVAVASAMTALLGLDNAFFAKVSGAFVLGAALVLSRLTKHHPFESFGAANQVTVIRAALVAVMAGLVGERADTGEPLLATVVAIIIIILDGVDGWLARRTRMTSDLGARFDMETDAALIMVLAALVWLYDKAGVWVLLSGLMRYVFVGAALVLPWMRRPLPPSTRRKFVAVVQIIALIVAVAPFVPTVVSAPTVLVGLAGLILSFGADIVWLVQNAGVRTTTVSAQ